MSSLYITEQGARITTGQGVFVVECKDGSKRNVPAETLESIMIMGSVGLSNSCMKECLRRGICVTLLSCYGHYYGRLESTGHVNAHRIKQQVYLSDDVVFSVAFTRKIQNAKVHNQLVVLKRYGRNRNVDISEECRQLLICQNKIERAESIEAIMGYEGYAARNYFHALSKIVNKEFEFHERNRRPPKDPFNAMLSLGYTIVLYETYAELESRGMTPYIGFMHKLKENHPALASDLIEEWRAVLVDATVLSLVQGREISINEFTYDAENGGVVISDKGVKTLVSKLEQKMRTNMNYLSYLEYPISFRKAIWWQVKSLAKCIDEGTIDSYEPLKIR